MAAGRWAVVDGPGTDGLDGPVGTIVLRAERLRALVLGVLFGGFWVLITGRVVAGLAAGQTAAWAAEALPVVAFVGSLALTEGVLYRSAVARLADGRGPSTLLQYVSTVVEVGGYTAGAIATIVGPGDPLDGSVVTLSLFVALSAFRMSLPLSAFTGAAAAVGYLALVYDATGGAYEGAVWVALFTVGGGVTVGLLARAVRQAAGRLVAETQTRAGLQADLLDSVEATQARIGRELHDGVGSHLTGLSFYARGLVKRLERGDAIEVAEMTDAAEMVDDGVRQVRRLARGLSPSVVEPGGLASALIGVAEGGAHATGVEVTARADTDLPPLAPDAEAHLLRIAQEAVTNALRHGQPSRVTVSLEHDDRGVVLTVEDDGQGFAPAHGPGVGLRTMGHRAALVGGALDVDTQGGGGTTIRVTIPTSGGGRAGASPAPSAQNKPRSASDV